MHGQGNQIPTAFIAAVAYNIQLVMAGCRGGESGISAPVGDAIRAFGADALHLPFIYGFRRKAIDDEGVAGNMIDGFPSVGIFLDIDAEVVHDEPIIHFCMHVVNGDITLLACVGAQVGGVLNIFTRCCSFRHQSNGEVVYRLVMNPVTPPMVTVGVL